MKASLRWVRESLAKRDVVAHMTHYHVEDGAIFSSDGRLTTSYPIDYKGPPFTVPGKDFELLIRRLDTEDLDIKVADGSVVIRHGASSGTLPSMPLGSWEAPRPLGKWKKMPKDLVADLRQLLPFTSQNATQPWALGVQLFGNKAVATNNIAIVTVPTAETPSVLFPIWCLEFLQQQEASPKSWEVMPDHVAFLWDNGAWVRTQLIDAVFPPVEAMLKDKWSEPRCAMKPAWIEALAYVVDLADIEIRLTPTRMYAVNGVLTSEVKIKSPIKQEQAWHGRTLLNALQISSHWAPAMYPEPCPFKGSNGLRGLIVGRHT